MIKLAGWLLRSSLFAIVILVLGNWVQIYGLTLSDHVKIRMNRIQKTEAANTIRRGVAAWSDTLTFSKSQARPDRPDLRQVERTGRSQQKLDRDLSAEERQELRNLLR